MLHQMKFGCFLGLLAIMPIEIHRLPRIKDYWGGDSLLGVPAVQQAMSLNRLNFLGHNNGLTYTC